MDLAAGTSPLRVWGGCGMGKENEKEGGRKGSGKGSGKECEKECEL